MGEPLPKIQELSDRGLVWRPPLSVSESEIKEAVLLSRKLAEDSAKQEMEDRRFSGWRPVVPTPSEEDGRGAFWKNALEVKENDPLIREKTVLLTGHSSYSPEMKRELLSVLNDLDRQKKLPIEVKKEAAALLVPNIAGMPELIKRYRKLALEFSKYECNDVVLYYAFHESWEGVKELNVIAGKTHRDGEEDYGGDVLLAERQYLGEGALLETERAFDEALNFEDEERYAETAAFLEFLKKQMDIGTDHLLFYTLQDVLKKKINEDTSALLKMRAEEILNASDFETGYTREENYFKYGERGVAFINQDGIHVASSPGEEILRAVEQMELCQERLRIAAMDLCNTDNRVRFLEGVLEAEEYGSGASISAKFEKEKDEEESRRILNPRLQRRFLENASISWKKLDDLSTKTREDVFRLMEEESERSAKLFGEITDIEEERKRLTGIIRGIHFRKLDKGGVTQSPGREFDADRDFLDYKYMLSPAMRRKITEIFSFPVHRLPPAEQFQFLNYIKSRNEDEMRAVGRFVAKYKEAGFRTFLSLEYGREFGDEILSLAEKLPKELVEKIFAKYAEIISFAEGIERSIQDRELMITPKKPINSAKLEDRLMRKARGVLVDFSTALSVSEREGEVLSEAEIFERLNLVKNELLLTGEMYKQGVVTLENLEQGGCSIKRATELTDREREEMLAIYRQNHITKYRGEHLEYLLKDFENKISALDGRAESVFHLLMTESQIGAFVSTREQEDGTLYKDDLETNPSLMGSSVGFDLFKKVTEMYPDRTLTGYVWAEEANKALIRKYAQAGWIIDDKNPERLGGAGNLYFKATRPPKVIPSSPREASAEIPKAA